MPEKLKQHDKSSMGVPPMIAFLDEGGRDAGVLASGQVAGIVEDLPSCADLIQTIVAEAVMTRMRSQAAYWLRHCATASA